MTRMRWMVAFLFVTTASLAAAKEQTATAVKVPQDLQKVVDEQGAAFNRQDAKKISTLFTVNGSFVNPGGARATGRAEIESRFAEDFAGPLKGAKGQLRIEKVVMISPTVAFLDLEQELSGPSLPEGLPQPARAHVVELMQKTGGKWMIAALRPYFFLHPPPGREGSAPTQSSGAAEPVRESGPTGSQQQH